MLDPMKEIKQSTRGKYRHINTKYQRMKKIEDLIKTRPYKRSELCVLFETGKSNISRYIDEMMLVLPVQEDEQRRVFIGEFK
jgi:hypothetical protein